MKGKMSFNFDKYIETANRIVNETAHGLGDDRDTDKAYKILKTVFHALRNILTVEESMELISQLPMVMKAVYVDGWKIHRKRRRVTHMGDFLDEVYAEVNGAVYYGAPGNELRDFRDEEFIERAVISVFSALRKNIPGGEIEEIKSVLPKELKILCDEPVAEFND